MGFLTVTQEAIDKSLKCSNGWAEFVIRGYKEEKAKSIQKPSINYNFDLECDVCSHDPKNIGRHASYTINNGYVMMSLPQLMFAAFQIKQEDIKPGDVQLDSFIGKRILAEIGQRPDKDNPGKVYDGQVLQMLPLGTILPDAF